jgi:superkiller protein 3
MAVRQAVHRGPHYPESHNINGLVSEVRSDFQSAIRFYQQARFAIGMMYNSKSDNKCALADVSVNLARSLCKVSVLHCYFHIWFDEVKCTNDNHMVFSLVDLNAD